MMKRFLAVMMIGSAVLISAAELKIAENGRACAGILIPADAKPVVKKAGQELAAYLQKITGAKFTVGTASSFKTNFRLGFGKPEGIARDGFVIRTNGSDIEIYGHDSARSFDWSVFYYQVAQKGTLLGVYYFLETLGVRWPLPDFEYVPKVKDLVVKDLDIRFSPFFSYRTCGGAAYNFVDRHADARSYAKTNADYMKWLIRIGESTNDTVVGSHSERMLGLDLDPEWTADPTRLMLGKDGKRVKRYSCWTHPDVLKLWLKAADGFFSGKSAAELGFKYNRGLKGSRWPWPFWYKDEFMIDPMDNDGVNDGRCYCERCNQFRKDHPCPDDSDLLWQVINTVAEDVHRKHPGKFITTLVYPPKSNVPNLRLSPNIRVKLCLGGPKSGLDQAAFEREMQRIAAWHKITGNKVPLWTYHCVVFNNAQPNMVEYYPGMLQKYIRGMKKHSSGMFMETHSANHTRKLITIYLCNRLMRDPDLDLEKELDDYFRAAYGPAHKEARAFWEEFEKAFIDFWKQTVPAGRRIGLSSPWGYNKKDMHMKLWQLAYTDEFMKRLGDKMDAMIKKTAGTEYARQTARVKKYIYDDLKAERTKAVDREKLRAALKIVVPRIKGSAPTAADWAAAPVYQLVPAEKFAEKVKNPASFRILASYENIFVRADIWDPLMKKNLTKAESGRIWKRNAFEVFFYAVKGDVRWQLIYYDWGLRACSRRVGLKNSWIVIPGSRSGIAKQNGKWMIDGIYPIKEILPQGGELRFNVTRERRTADNQFEFTSWSPLAGTRGWHDPGNYPTVTFK
ncbi:MAG: DUF4838 domain-containing protein [Lentisphaeria bacterium]|nr:DUF4838 domain-containing protein [Lentisphaeria bacterium]